MLPSSLVFLFLCDMHQMANAPSLIILRKEATESSLEGSRVLFELDFAFILHTFITSSLAFQMSFIGAVQFIRQLMKDTHYNDRVGLIVLGMWGELFVLFLKFASSSIFAKLIRSYL